MKVSARHTVYVRRWACLWWTVQVEGWSLVDGPGRRLESGRWYR